MAGRQDSRPSAGHGVTSHGRSAFFDRTGLFLLLWFAFFTPFAITALSLGLVFPVEYTGNILTGKFTLIGLVGAVISLQYVDWRQAYDKTFESVFDVAWMVRDLQLNDRSETITDDAARADLNHELKQVGHWHERRINSVKQLLDILAGQRFVLIALVSGVYFLCLSSVSDLAGLIFDPAGRQWRSFSLGALAGAFAPFLTALFFLIGKLQGSFAGTEDIFLGVLAKSQARLHELGEVRRKEDDGK